MSRVIYEKNPLIEVVLQIQFPTNLSISTQEPIVFQNAIKNDFPNYRQEIQNEKEISLLPNNNEIKPFVRNKNTKIHTFITKEGFSKISLSNSTISISTLKYERWEFFIELFTKTVKEFLNIYSPPYIERIGLRYIDAFKRKELNLNGVSWNKLINHPWIGVLDTIDENKALLSSLDTEYILDDNISHLKVHSGLGRINNYQDPVFIIDSDFIHIANENVDDWESITNRLHDYSDNFYQSTITPQLKKALKPKEI